MLSVQLDDGGVPFAVVDVPITIHPANETPTTHPHVISAPLEPRPSALRLRRSQQSADMALCMRVSAEDAGAEWTSRRSGAVLEKGEVEKVLKKQVDAVSSLKRRPTAAPGVEGGAEGGVGGRSRWGGWA